MAKLNTYAPFATTRTHLLSAVTSTTALVLGLALLAGFLRGLQTFFDIVLGSAVVLLPSLWVAVSVTSGHSAVSPALMGLARYTLAGLGFAALFALRPSSEPLPVLAGSMASLVLPSVLLLWRQRQVSPPRRADETAVSGRSGTRCARQKAAENANKSL